eukprot:UC1_evm1s592
MFEHALREGCRCIELDIWDGPDGVPVVKRNYTKQSHLPLADCLDVIVAAAFATSEFPVILHIEMHAEGEQQVAASTLLSSTLSDALVVLDQEAQLPSPQALRNKFIIMSLKLDRESETQARRSTIWAPDEAAMYKQRGNRRGRTGRRVEADESPRVPEKEMELTPEFSRLVSLQIVKYNGPEDSFRDAQHLSARSVREKYLDAAVDDTALANQLIRLAQRAFVRFVPDHTRVNSDNQSSSLPFSLGVQLVPINYQTKDVHFFLNRAWFRQNGGCGYTQKPHVL